MFDDFINENRDLKNVKKYIKGKVSFCPQCESLDIIIEKTLDAPGLTYYYLKCNECNFRWATINV